MTKYSLEFKLKIVTAYMNNEGGYTFLAKKYGIKADAQVQRWFRRIKSFVLKDFVELWIFITVKL